MNKISVRIAVGLLVVAAFAASLQIGADRFGWSTPLDGDARVSAEAPPPHVLTGIDPAFGPECGEYGVDVVTVGYGVNTDLQHHTRESIAIVEGTAHVTGPARFGNLKYSPELNRHEQIEVASQISTPFRIEVSKSHKGPAKREWLVSELGGLVECVSHRLSSDAVRLFDGVTGLFYISSEPREVEGAWVSMTITEEAPEWFIFTEQHFGPIEDAVALIKSPDLSNPAP